MFGHQKQWSPPLNPLKCVQSPAGLPYRIIGREKDTFRAQVGADYAVLVVEFYVLRDMLPDPSSLSIPELNSPFAAPKQRAEDLDVPCRAVGVNEIHVAFSDFATDVQQDLRAGRVCS